MQQTTSIGATVKARRLELALSVAELADRSCVGRATIYRIEDEGRVPRMATARALAAVLRLPVADLMPERVPA